MAPSLPPCGWGSQMYDRQRHGEYGWHLRGCPPWLLFFLTRNWETWKILSSWEAEGWMLQVERKKERCNREKKLKDTLLLPKYVCMLSYFSRFQIFVARPWGSSVPGILQARIHGVSCHALLQGIFPTQDQTCISYVSCIGRCVLLSLRPPGKPLPKYSQP